MIWDLSGNYLPSTGMNNCVSPKLTVGCRAVKISVLFVDELQNKEPGTEHRELGQNLFAYYSVLFLFLPPKTGDVAARSVHIFCKRHFSQ